MLQTVTSIQQALGCITSDLLQQQRQWLLSLRFGPAVHRPHETYNFIIPIEGMVSQNSLLLFQADFGCFFQGSGKKHLARSSVACIERFLDIQYPISEPHTHPKK